MPIHFLFYSHPNDCEQRRNMMTKKKRCVNAKKKLFAINKPLIYR